MKRLIRYTLLASALFCSVVANAQICCSDSSQIAPYPRTHDKHVLTDWSTRSLYFQGVPFGTVPLTPVTVPDSVKPGNLFYNTTKHRLHYYDETISDYQELVSKYALEHDTISFQGPISFGSSVTFNEGALFLNNIALTGQNVLTNNGYMLANPGSYWNFLDPLDVNRYWKVIDNDSTLSIFHHVNLLGDKGIRIDGNDIKDLAGNTFLKTGGTGANSGYTALKADTLLNAKQDTSVASITDLQAYTGAMKYIHVRDKIRGGDFVLTTGTTNDNGITFSSALTGQHWHRQIYDNQMLIEWYDSAPTDSTTTSTAMNLALQSDTINYKGKYKVTSKSHKVIFTSTVNISKDVSVPMDNVILTPDSSFTKGGTMVNVFGYGASSHTSQISRLDLKIDGGTRKVVGITYRMRLLGARQRFSLTNCAVGINVTGNSEKQDFDIGTVSCDTTVKSTAEGAYSPDENHYYITGGNCLTYYYQGVNAQISDHVYLDVENTPVNTTNYAVDVRGAKFIELMGEVRATQGAGAVRISGSTTLSVKFTGLSIINNKTGNSLSVNSCADLNGDVLCKQNNSSSYGAYIGTTQTGGTLSIASDGGSIPIVIGDNANSRRTRGMTIFANVLSSSSGQGALFDNMELCHVTLAGVSLPFTVANRIAYSKIYVSANYLRNNVAITNTTNTTAWNLVFFGGIPNTYVTGYSTPVAGMRVENITDKDYASAHYNGTSWIYESDYLNQTQADARYLQSSGASPMTGPLTLATGTTTLASVLFPVSTLLTTPVPGAVLFDGTNLFYDISGIHRTIVNTSAGQTLSNKSFSNSTTFTGIQRGVSSTKTSAYTTTQNDDILVCNSTSAGFNLTLLSTANVGTEYTIDNSVATANAVTVVGTINGATNYTLNSAKYITIYKTATGSNTWRIIANN